MERTRFTIFGYQYLTMKQDTTGYCIATLYLMGEVYQAVPVNLFKCSVGDLGLSCVYPGFPQPIKNLVIDISNTK